MESESSNIELIKGMPLSTRISEMIRQWERPFGPRQPLVENTALTAEKLVKGIERVLGFKIYTKIPFSSTNSVPARFHNLAIMLAEKKMLTSINSPEPMPGWPQIPMLFITSDTHIDASGYDLNIDRAAEKAFAELIERYALIEFDLSTQIIGKFSKTRSGSAINPESFSFFSNDQLASHTDCNHRVTPESTFRWQKVTDLDTGKQKLIPAQLVFLRYPLLSGEPQILMSTSNGAAAGISKEMATYNGICELIERDAFMIHWLLRITPPRIRIEQQLNLDPSLSELVRIYQKHKIKFVLADITTDIKVPTVLMTVEPEAADYPHVYVSARADLNIRDAVYSVLTDGLRAGYAKLKKGEKKLPTPSQITDINERRTYWSHSDRKIDARFLMTGAERESNILYDSRNLSNDFKTKLGHLKKILKDRKHRIYIADITSSTAKNFGLTVIKAISPDLYPLYLSEHFKYLGHKRLLEVSEHMKHENRKKQDDLYNPIPHPFL